MTDLTLDDRRLNADDVKSFVAGYMTSVVVFAVLGPVAAAHGLWKLWRGDVLALETVAGAIVAAGALGAYGLYTIVARRWCYLDVTLKSGAEFRVRGGRREILAHVARLEQAGVAPG